MAWAIGASQPDDWAIGASQPTAAAGLSIPIAMYHYMNHSFITPFLLPYMWMKQDKVTRRDFLRNTGLTMFGL